MISRRNRSKKLSYCTVLYSTNEKQHNRREKNPYFWHGISIARMGRAAWSLDSHALVITPFQASLLVIEIMHTLARASVELLNRDHWLQGTLELRRRERAPQHILLKRISDRSHNHPLVER